MAQLCRLNLNMITRGSGAGSQLERDTKRGLEEYWAPPVTGLLTQRGLLIRDSESLGVVFWKPVVKVEFPSATQSLSLEPENFLPHEQDGANSLPMGHYGEPA